MENWEWVDLKKNTFNPQILNIFENIFASFPWNSVSNYGVAWMGLHLYDYHSFQVCALICYTVYLSMYLSIYVVVGNVNMSPTLRKIKHYNPMQEKVPSIYQATGASQLIENFLEEVLQCDFYVRLVWIRAID